jgi:hypothetical protein
MGGSRSLGSRWDVPETQLVLRPSPGGFTGVQGRLSLVGRNDAHSLSRTALW